MISQQRSQAQKEENDSAALVQASVNNHLGVVRRLIDKGADVNAADSNGATELIMASENGHR